ncbi:carboxypeptidase-like regulatory domain-containing protein [Winogradskyella tangerina]|uniref:carboxypeptidase-like regulatory domain-containing protein n=1 Tax=Winogradskyella tangerina TaxID=2023240 RepID=UPI000DBE6172|nr:carboxypeptidase-like regulatory domain-containing protein [Winogradskyella tangerina]
MRKISTLLFVFLLSFISFGQETSEIICRVIDEELKFPVSYATVQISNSSKGTIANIDGDFRIPLKFRAEKKTIIISSIGYETLEVELETLSPTELNIIEITAKTEELDQVLIKSTTPAKRYNISPYSIVKKAIINIPKNHPTSQYSKIGYYRDYQIVRGRYYNLNEAIIETFDAGFQTDVIMGQYNQSALYSYVENTEFLRDPNLLLPYDGKRKFINNTDLSAQGGNELGILNIHNPIRNFEQLGFSFVYVFKKKFLDNHELTDIKKVYLNDDVLFEITFKAKQSLTKASHKASGKIYIAQSDYAIHKFTYKVFEIKIDDPLFEVEIEYKKKNDLMYLNYITFNNQFIINDNYKFDVNTIEYDNTEQAFLVHFNREVNPATLDRKDFKFRFNKKKMMVKSVELKDSVTAKVAIEEWSLPEVDENTDMSQFNYKIKNIYDITNRKLYDSPKIVGFQFREFFVQEVFEDKALNEDVTFINKFRPLSEAKINELEMTKNYWLNTPLKQTRQSLRP